MMHSLSEAIEQAALTSGAAGAKDATLIHHNTTAGSEFGDHTTVCPGAVRVPHRQGRSTGLLCLLAHLVPWARVSTLHRSLHPPAPIPEGGRLDKLPTRRTTGGQPAAPRVFRSDCLFDIPSLINYKPRFGRQGNHFLRDHQRVVVVNTRFVRIIIPEFETFDRDLGD